MYFIKCFHLNNELLRDFVNRKNTRKFAVQIVHLVQPSKSLKCVVSMYRLAFIRWRSYDSANLYLRHIFKNSKNWIKQLLLGYFFD